MSIHLPMVEDSSELVIFIFKAILYQIDRVGAIVKSQDKSKSNQINRERKKKKKQEGKVISSYSIYIGSFDMQSHFNEW